MKKRITVLLALILTMIMSVSALAEIVPIYVYTGSEPVVSGMYLYDDVANERLAYAIEIDTEIELGKQNISESTKDNGKKVLTGWNVWNTECGVEVMSYSKFYSVDESYENGPWDGLFEAIYEDVVTEETEETEKTVGRSYSLERINTIKDLSIIHTDGVVRDSQMKTAVDFVNKYSHPTITVISSGDSITLPAGMTKDMDDNTDVDLILMNRWGGIVIPDEMLELVGDKELTITITENEIVITADGEPLVFEDGIKMTIPYTRRSTTGNVAVSVTVGEETAVQENGYDQSTDTISFTIKGSCGFARINDYSADGTGTKSNVYVSSPNR